jgi:hypothetical protein
MFKNINLIIASIFLKVQVLMEENINENSELLSDFYELVLRNIGLKT